MIVERLYKSSARDSLSANRLEYMDLSTINIWIFFKEKIDFSFLQFTPINETLLEKRKATCET